MNTEILVWDNEITAREYISYIAEQSGTFAYIGRDGKLYFKKIGEDSIELNKRFFRDIKFGEQFKISRIAYEDGIQDFKKGTIKNNTVWINQDNMYITNQEQIDNIYAQYKDFECYSFEGSTIIDPAIEVGDIIVIDDKKIIYQGELSFAGKFITSIKSNIKSKIKQDSSVKNKSEKSKIRRIESKIDQVEGNIDLIGNEISEYENKLSNLELNIDSITQKLENKIDITREVTGITKIKLEDCMKGELLELHIYGNNTVFERVLPSENLYPSKNLYPKGFGKIAINKINLKSDIQCVIANLDIVNHQYNTGLQFCRSLVIPIEQKSKKYTIFKKAGARFAVGTFDKEPSQGIIATNYISDENEGNGLTKLELTSADNDKYLVVFFYDAYNDSESLTMLYDSIEIYADYQEIELTQLKRGLKQFEGVCDELVIKDSKLEVIRRIGTDTEGNKYLLENENIEELSEIKIELAEGVNYIEILNYVANMKAKYVVRNEFTNRFATTVELKSSITQLVDSINLIASEKVGEDEIIAKLNVAIEGEQGIVKIEGNKIVINTDYFKINEDGTAEILNRKNIDYVYTELDIILALQHIRGDIVLPQFLIDMYKCNPNNTDSNINILDATTMLNIKNGKIPPVKTIDVNININPNDFEKTINIKTNDIFQTLLGTYQMYSYMLQCSYIYCGSSYSSENLPNTAGVFIDGQKGTIRLNNLNSKTTAYLSGDEISSYAIAASDGIGNGTCIHGINKSHNYACDWDGNQMIFYVDGQSAVTVSDKRLKTNINSINERILNAISKIKFKQFIAHNKPTGISFGVIAQELISEFKLNGLNIWDFNIVSEIKYEANDETLYYIVDYEQFLILKMKCLENLSKKQEKEIENLSTKLEELENERNEIKKKIDFLVRKINSEDKK